MKPVLMLLVAGLAGCANLKPDNELLTEPGYRTQAPKPTPPELGKPSNPMFGQTLAKGGDKNDPGGYEGSGGTGDGGG